jgi:hypothetical protein
MWHVFHLIARPIEALLGVFCVLTAIVLYPDEEGKIQSKFEDFWVRVDDIQNVVLSRHAVFMTQVAKLESRFLDSVFGEKLVSMQAFAVSCCCTMIIIFEYGAYEEHHRISMEKWGLESRPSLWEQLLLPIILFLVLSAGIASARKHKAKRVLVTIGIFTVLVPVFNLIVGHNFDMLRLAIILNLGLLVGFIGDALFIGLTRRLLRWAGTMTSSSKVLTVITLNLVFAAALVAPAFTIHPAELDFDKTNIEKTVATGINTARAIAICNVVDAVFALLFVFLAALLLIHRLFWPLLTRTLFRMTDIGTKGRRAILTTVGLALLAAGISGKVPELVQKVIEKFGG